jgi:alkyl hydroperoxide reductase subunit AhpC
MLRVGLAAPHFDCSAVVAGRLVRLGWRQVHENKALVLLFDSLDAQIHASDDLLAVSNAVMRLSHQRVKAAVICRNDLGDILAWINDPTRCSEDVAFPLIVDPEGRIAALYGVQADGRLPVWGQFLIDSSGVIRQAAVSGFPICPSVEELLRSIRASGFPAETDQWN